MGIGYQARNGEDVDCHWIALLRAIPFLSRD